jgi:hypothetical protein
MAVTSLATAYVNIVPSFKGFGTAVTKDLDNELGAAGMVGGHTLGSGILGSLKGFVAPLAAVLGTVAIGKFFKDAVSEASNLAESQNAIKVTFGDAASEIQKLGANAATTLGLSNVQFNELAVRFSSFAKTVAGPGGDVTKTLDEMTRRASDFASVMNIDVSEAAQVFQSGLAGETEPLKRFGIDLSDAAIKAYAMANGIGEGRKELTEAEKVTARYGLLMQSTAQTAGDFANTQDGLANGLRILKSSFADVKANIGTAFLPFMAMGVQALNSFMGPLKEATKAFSDWGTAIGDVFTKAGGGAAGFSAVMDNIGQSISAWFSGGGLFQAFAGISALRTQLFNSMIEAMPGLINGMIDFLPQLVSFITETLIPQMVGQFAGTVTAIADLISTSVPRLVYAIAGLLPVLISSIAAMLPGLIAQLLSLVPVLIDAGLTLFSSLVTAFVVMVPQLVNAIVEMLPPIVNSLLSMLPGIIQAGLDLFTGLIDGLLILLPILLTAVIDMLPPLLDALLSMLPELILASVTLFLALVTGLAGALPEIITAVIEMVPKLAQTLVNMLPKLIDAGIKLFLGLVEAVSTALPEIITAVIKLIPEITGALIKAIPQLIDAGFQLLKGLAKGLWDNAPTILGSLAKSLGDLLVGSVKAIFGIKSPSRVFFSIGEYLMQGLANGISDTQSLAEKAMSGVADLMNAGFGNAQVNGSISGSASISSTAAPQVTSPLGDFKAAFDANGGTAQTVNYYAAPNQSIDSEQALFTAIKRAKVLASW